MDTVKRRYDSFKYGLVMKKENKLIRRRCYGYIKHRDKGLTKSKNGMYLFEFIFKVI